MKSWRALILVLAGSAIWFAAGWLAHEPAKNQIVPPKTHLRLLQRVQDACRHAGGVASVQAHNSKILGEYVIVTCVDIYASQKLVPAH